MAARPHAAALPLEPSQHHAKTSTGAQDDHMDMAFCESMCSAPPPCTALHLQNCLRAGATMPASKPAVMAAWSTVSHAAPSLETMAQPAVAPCEPAPSVVHAVDFLTQRCVSCRSPAAHSMPLRPTLQHLHGQLVDLLQCVGQDTSLSMVIVGDHGTGKTLLVERALATITALHSPAPAANTLAERDAALGRKLGVVRLSGLLHLEERPAFQEIARQLCSEFGQEYSSKATFEENLIFLRNMLATLHQNCKTVVFVLDFFERFARARGKQQLLYNLFDVLQHSKVQAAVIGVTCAHNVLDNMEKRVRSRFSHRRMELTTLSTLEVIAAAPGQAKGATSPTAAASRLKPAAAPTTGAAAQAARQAKTAAVADNAPPAPTYADTPAGILQDLLSLPVCGGGAAATTEGCTPRATVLVAGGQAHGCGLAFVQRHNQAVATAVRDVKVKAALSQLFLRSLTPRGLATAARAMLDAWEQDAWIDAARRTAAAAGRDGEVVSEEPSIMLDSEEEEDMAPSAGRGGTASATLGRGSEELVPPSALLQPRHVLCGLQTLQPTVPFQVFHVCQLSVLQLYLLAGMTRLEGKSRQVYNFEMVWDECQSFRDAKGILSGFTHEAAWTAFQQIVATNLVFWVSPGAEAAGREMQYAGVSLALTSDEVHAGIKEHSHCPNELFRFLNSEA